MKLDNIKTIPSKEGIEIKRKQDKELTLVGSDRKVKGLRLYEYDKATGEVQPATYIENDTYQLGIGVETKVFIRPNCVYVQAMNKANAFKKARKSLI